MRDYTDTATIEARSYGIIKEKVERGGWRAEMRDCSTRILSNAKRLCPMPRVGQEIIILHGPANLKGKWKLSQAEERRQGLLK